MTGRSTVVVFLLLTPFFGRMPSFKVLHFSMVSFIELGLIPYRGLPMFMSGGGCNGSKKCHLHQRFPMLRNRCSHSHTVQ